jgi:hypothetical protein
MPSAQALRIQIEQALERRIPAALSPRPRAACNTATTGVPEIDDLLEGGLPIGAISELTGLSCSGRTSLALAFLAARTQQAQVCAWVDVDDSLNPESAAASGVHLNQLLWVRCQNGESRQAVKEKYRQPYGLKPWTRLDQAVRATDLLLQSGGFSAIVLDMGSVAPQFARRIPLATWFRFRQAAQRAQCSLIVLAQIASAQSSAEVVLECTRLNSESASETVLNGFTYQVRRERGTAAKSALSIIGPRKPPASTWSAPAAWIPRRRA